MKRPTLTLLALTGAVSIDAAPFRKTIDDFVHEKLKDLAWGVGYTDTSNDLPSNPPYDNDILNENYKQGYAGIQDVLLRDVQPEPDPEGYSGGPCGE